MNLTTPLFWATCQQLASNCNSYLCIKVNAKLRFQNFNMGHVILTTVHFELINHQSTCLLVKIIENK